MICRTVFLSLIHIYGTAEEMKIRCVYLAAGNSRRFGKNKLFHMVGQKPMYLHLLDRLAAVAERHKELEIVVVSQ